MLSGIAALVVDTCGSRGANDEVNSPSQMAAAYDAAFASYTDARRRFQELKQLEATFPSSP